MRRVKIICTIGPASREVDVLTQLAEAGMNVARLNFSHGTHEYHRGTIERVRQVSEKVRQPIAILADLQGPKLRVGTMQKGGVPLKKGEKVTLTIEEVTGEPGRIPIQYKDLPGRTRPGERILFDDGLLEVEVISNTESEIVAEVIIGGILTDNKGMNLPDASLDIPALTPKDIEDVHFALTNQVDWIALSFVRTAHEVLELKAIIQNDSAYGRVPPVISKIEKPEAVRNIDAIIRASDAIMVARGDLGIETAPETVPMVQKMIIMKCLAAAKPVVTATQMLDSMIRNPRPTRAEASDVANAVLDGSDAIMLSGETATGLFPVEAVQTMVKIAAQAEQVLLTSDYRARFEEPEIYTGAGAICHAAMQTADELNAKAIIAPTISGATARFIASFRPKVPVIAVTPSPMVQRQLCMYWGTYPLLTRRLSNTDEVINDAIRVAQENSMVNPGDTVVLTAGVVGSVRSATNLMMVRTIERVLATGIGLGRREIAGRIVNLSMPVNGSTPNIGPQDIIFAANVDRSAAQLLQRAGGLITPDQGLDSYGAVAAVELGIPAIVGAQGNLEELVDGKSVILDASTGQIIEWKK
jgi:pyruvate kinase